MGEKNVYKNRYIVLVKLNLEKGEGHMASKKKYNPISYIKYKNPGAYTSQYANQLASARNQLMNFRYNPLEDASYQALAQVYNARGNIAAQDTLADAASLNGGNQTSYAVSAAQQARNQYNQELASLVPQFAESAYNRLQTNYGLLMDADNQAYQQYRDKVADYQWGKGYDTDIYQFKLSQKKSSGGGGGRRRSGGGGGGYVGGSTSGSTDLTSLYQDVQDKLNKDKKKKSGAGGGGGNTKRINKNVMMTK